MFFGRIPLSRIDAVWPICRQYLEPAVSDHLNIYTIDDYYNPLKNGELQLWAAADDKIIGAVLTSIDRGSANTICSVHSLAGERLKEWVHLCAEEITAYARAHKCRAIESVTRKGIKGLFPDLKKTGEIYTRFLE